MKNRMIDFLADLVQLIAVLSFAWFVFQITGCAMSEERQMQYDACETDNCRAQAKRNDRQDREYAQHERKVKAYDRFVALPALCNRMGLMMAFRCETTSRACGRKKRNSGMDDYSLMELRSAGCIKSIKDMFP